MKRHLTLVALFLAALGFSACVGGTESVGGHVNALTGKVCEPNDSYTPRPETRGGRGNGQGGNDQCQGTSNGDNCDDVHSGQIDCIGDGNSGEGDDRKHNCEFPQPGCDDEGCCDDDMVPPPPPPDDGSGDDGSGDDGSGDDGSGDVSEPEPEPTDPEVPPIG
jgi:hypothetical protein